MSYEKLVQAGIDIESLLQRLMGNSALIDVFVRKFTEDGNYELLCAAFADGDMKKAEMASHTLKGMCGNMSLTLLFEMFTRQVNLIRANDFEAARQMMDGISREYTKAIAMMNEWLDA